MLVNTTQNVNIWFVLNLINQVLTGEEGSGLSDLARFVAAKLRKHKGDYLACIDLQRGMEGLASAFGAHGDHNPQGLPASFQVPSFLLMSSGLKRFSSFFLLLLVNAPAQINQAAYNLKLKQQHRPARPPHARKPTGHLRDLTPPICLTQAIGTKLFCS